MAVVDASFVTRQKKKAETLVLPAGVIALVVALTVFVLVPQGRKIRDDKDEVDQLKERVQLLNEKATFLATLDVAELAVRVDKLEKALPSSQDYGYYLTALRSMIRRAGLLYEGADLSGTVTAIRQTAKGVPKIARERTVVRQREDFTKITVSFAGEIATVQQFFKEIEESIPLSVVESGSATRDGETEEMTGRLVLNYFHSAVPETISAVDEPLAVITGQEEQAYSQILEFREPDTVELPRVPTGNPNLML